MSEDGKSEHIHLQPFSYSTFEEEEMPVCEPGPDGSCAICADEGVEGRVLELQADNMALVQMENRVQEVAVDLIAEPQVGDVLLVHLGFAIARVEV